jgi:signal transduction histidine kinase/ActR/RegA family two-component response regulator
MLLHYSSIRNKLIAIVLSTTLVALLFALIGNLAGDIYQLRRSLVADMSTQAELVGRMATAALAFEDQKLATENLRTLDARGNIKAAAIYTDRGKLFARYAAAGERPEFAAVPETDGVHLQDGHLVVFKRIVHDGNLLGTVYLRADYDVARTVLADIAIALVIAMLAMAIAFLMIRRLEKLVTRPISAVAAAAREVVQQGDYSRRVVKESNDEVGALTDSFNDMLSEIERRTQDLEVSNREISREVQQRQLAQHEAMRLNVDLEARVRARTAELEVAMAAAEHANQGKSAFLSSMSHELRTPLNAILGFTQLLASDAKPVTNERRKEFTGFILKAGTHLLELINEILDLAKIESGELRLSLEPVSLSEIMADCQAMIEPLGLQRNLLMTFPKDQQFTLLADRTRLKQILLNLLSNAIKYNRDAGMLTVVYAPGPERRLRISIHDSGVGLDAEQLNALFQPFNRLGQESGLVEGTGIGLVVTKRLVELMQGSIGVTSTVGVGSVFWIELHAIDPVSRVQQIADIDKQSQLAAVPDRAALSTLLYIEDNPANLRLIEEIILFIPGLRLLSAPDAHLGLQLARAHMPDLILMDLHLPGMSGIEALKVLRADPATAAIPVIAVTASAMPRDIKVGMESGFFGYLTKPIDIEQFIKAIQSALAIARARRQPNPTATQETP